MKQSPSFSERQKKFDDMVMRVSSFPEVGRVHFGLSEDGRFGYFNTENEFPPALKEILEKRHPGWAYCTIVKHEQADPAKGKPRSPCVYETLSTFKVDA